MLNLWRADLTYLIESAIIWVAISSEEFSKLYQTSEMDRSPEVVNGYFEPLNIYAKRSIVDAPLLAMLLSYWFISNSVQIFLLSW